MNTNNILSADLLDILFDNRNKTYGAYDLRKTYNHRIKKALLLTGGFLSLVMLGTAFANSGDDKDNNLREKTVMRTIAEIPPEKKPEVIIPEKKPELIQEKTEPYTVLKIVEDDKFKSPPPENTDLKTANIGDEKLDGLDPSGIVKPAEIPEGTGIIEEKKVIEPEIWTKVEVDATYEGDWAKFLNRQLNPQVPSDNGAPEGSYRVLIQFVVDLDGTVSNLTPLTNMGYGMEQEAMRVIKKSLKWKPAFQNSKNVKAYRTQPITFQVLPE